MTEGSAWYPWTTLKASTEVLALRLAKRYDVSWVQHEFLESHVSERYAGQGGSREGMRAGLCRDEDVRPRPGVFKDTSYAVDMVSSAWQAVLKKRKGKDSRWRSPPLGALIDERLTNLIVLYQLNGALKSKALGLKI